MAGYKSKKMLTDRQPQATDDEQDDLTLVYMWAFKKGKESAKVRIEQLTSGPGGIMEMKQTIADKEQRIEKLESQFKLYFHAFNKAANHIEKLEAALREIAECNVEREHVTIFRNDGVLSKHDKCKHDRVMYEDCEHCISDFARAALGEKK
jgi:hypothetical protein